jgi:hypothetical protein
MQLKVKQLTIRCVALPNKERDEDRVRAFHVIRPSTSTSGTIQLRVCEVR